MLARLGGDEFGALLVDTSKGQALAAVDRLRQMTPRLGSFSAGAASGMAARAWTSSCVARTSALYEAKTDGGSWMQLAPPTLEPSGRLRAGGARRRLSQAARIIR